MRRKSTAKARGESAKLVKRYDPTTGIRTYVPKDSDEADSWPTRKPKLGKKWQALTDKALGSPLAGEALRAAVPILKKPGAIVGKGAKVVATAVAAGAKDGLAKLAEYRAATTVAAKAAAGTASQVGKIAAGGAAATSATAALVIGAGLLAYWITKYLIAIPARRREDRAEKAFAASQAYRKARDELAAKMGRALTPEEQLQLGNQFKAELAKLGLSTTDLSKL